jgi:hypothetical protein
MRNGFFLFPLLLLLVASSYFHHEERPLRERRSNLEAILDTRIQEFNLNNETIEVGLKRLATGAIVFAMGFEHELKSKLTDPPIPDPRLTLHLKMVTVHETLDAMCRADARYTWSTDETFVKSIQSRLRMTLPIF